MNRFPTSIPLTACLALAFAGAAQAGAPQPETRQGEFVHVCRGGPNKAQACTVATEDLDCPRSECVVTALGKPISGMLTLIAHDSVTDWLNGGSSSQALTVLLEVRAPDRSKQILAASYQDLVTPANPPSAPGNVVAIPMDELAVKTLAGDPSGLSFVRPESTLGQQLQDLFDSTGTPVIFAVGSRGAQFADHTGDGLATVLRFRVVVRFLQPLVTAADL